MALLLRRGDPRVLLKTHRTFRVPNCNHWMALKNRQSPVWHLPRQCLRQNSTTSEAARSASALTRRLRNLVYGTSFVLILTFSYLYGTDTRAGIHRWLIPRSLRWIYDDAEEAHHAGKKALKTLHEFGLNPRERGNPDQNGDLKVEVCHERK